MLLSLPDPLAFPNGVRHAFHNEVHAGNGYAVAQRFISRTVRCTGNIRPSVRKSLQPFAFQRRQTADQQDGQVVVTGRLTGVQRIRLTVYYQISGVLTLPCALRTGDLIGREPVHTLAAENGMAVHGVERIGHIFLIPDAVAAVFRLPVYGIAGDTVALRWSTRKALRHKGLVGVAQIFGILRENLGTFAAQGLRGFCGSSQIVV